MATFIKDPNDNPKEFYIDWTSWLHVGETIAASTVTVEAGLTKVSDSEALGIVSVVVTGGTDTVEYDITNQVTSSLGRVESQTVTVLVLESNATAAAHEPISKVGETPWNLLPLEDWRQVLSYNPFHFWQLANATVPVTSMCNTIVRQYAWQAAQAVGRAEIRQAILTAEDRLREYLGYSVAPHYRMESLAWPQYWDRQFEQGGYWAADARWKTVQLSEGYIHAVGVETLSVVQLEATVSYSDEDSDGLYDTFTLSAATSVFDEEEIAVYFSACDRLDGEGPGEKYRIAPVNVTIASGILTVKGRAWQCVKPILYEGVGTAALDPDTLTNLAAALDIYQRYTSTAGNTFDTAQAVLIWETRPWPYWATSGISDPTGYATDPAGMAYALARVGIRNARMGVVGIGETVYDAATDSWSMVDWDGGRPPDRVLVRYCAGFPTENGRVASSLRQIVARLAAAELTRPICACENANQELYHWQFDLSRAGGANDEQYSVSGDTLLNPFGTRRGQVYAWRQALNLRQERAFVP